MSDQEKMLHITAGPPLEEISSLKPGDKVTFWVQHSYGGELMGRPVEASVAITHVRPPEGSRDRYAIGRYIIVGTLDSGLRRNFIYDPKRRSGIVRS